MDMPSTSSSPLDLQRYRTYLLLLARSHDKIGGEECLMDLLRAEDILPATN